MRIAVIGRGNVGGGLADRWERKGHDVTRLGRDGGDVGDAEAILLAVPGGRVAEVLDACGGLEGRTVLDATNLVGAAPPDGFASNAEYVKARTGGPTAKTFNLNFAALYDRIDDTRSTPCNVWCGDEEAREVVERLNADAGYEPLYAGGLENAGAQEVALALIFAVSQGGMGPYFYRMAPPGRL